VRSWWSGHGVKKGWYFGRVTGYNPSAKVYKYTVRFEIDGKEVKRTELQVQPEIEPLGQNKTIPLTIPTGTTGPSGRHTMASMSSPRSGTKTSSRSVTHPRWVGGCMSSSCIGLTFPSPSMTCSSCHRRASQLSRRGGSTERGPPCPPRELSLEGFGVGMQQSVILYQLNQLSKTSVIQSQSLPCEFSLVGLMDGLQQPRPCLQRNVFNISHVFQTHVFQTQGHSLVIPLRRLSTSSLGQVCVAFPRFIERWSPPSKLLEPFPHEHFLGNSIFHWWHATAASTPGSSNGFPERFPRKDPASQTPPHVVKQSEEAAVLPSAIIILGEGFANLCKTPQNYDCRIIYI